MLSVRAMNTGPATDEPHVLRLSTSQFGDRDAVEAFREVFGRAILRIEIEPTETGPFDADLTIRSFNGFGLAGGRLSGMSNTHTEALIDNDDVVLVMIDGGAAVLEHKGRTVEVGDGEVALTDSGEAGTFATVTPLRVTNLRFARQNLGLGEARLGHALRASKVPQTPALRLLKHYVASLSHEAALQSAETRRTVATHLHDLAALALGATNDAAAVATGRGLRGARLQAIRADIQQNLSDPRLSAETVARRQGITARYVRLLLESEGESFSGLVMGARLERALRMLADPRMAHRTISGIAFDCGFSDLSYFNRSFRRRFGLTPSEARNAG